MSSKQGSAQLNLLLVDESELDFRRISDLLNRVPSSTYTLDWAETPERGRQLLNSSVIDACLLSLGWGHDVACKLIQQVREDGWGGPFIILAKNLSGDHDDLSLLRSGASDYLVKGKIQPSYLERAILYSLERRKAMRETFEVEKEVFFLQKMQVMGKLASTLQDKLQETIQGISGHLEYIKENIAKGSDLEKSAKISHEASKQASLLLEHILSFSPNEGILSDNINLQELLIKTVEFIRSICPRNIIINFEAERHQAINIKGNAQELRQMLIELATNSIEAMPEGGTINIKIGTNHLDSPPVPSARFNPGKYVELVIRDSGSGIAPEEIEQVHDPLYTTKARNFGLGLGLARALAIMDKHSGYITLKSGIGLGTFVHLYFPLTNAQVGLNLAPEANLKTENLNHKAKKGLVLAIDDDLTLSTLLEIYLQSAGIESKVFTSPREAIEWFKANNDLVNLVLLDMIMPELNGKDCFYELKKINPEIPIALSSAVVSSEVKELLENGAVKFFQKPNSYPSIVTWISEKITQPSLS